MTDRSPAAQPMAAAPARKGSAVSPPATSPGAPETGAWQRVRRLLAVRVDNLGDVLMTTPALAAAAASVPGIAISLLGNEGTAALAPHLPMVSEVITAGVPWVRHESGPIDDGSALVARLAAGRFDAAVIFTVCTQSALPAATLCWLAGIPLRLAHVRENPYGLLTDWAPEVDVQVATARHEVRRQLDLVARVGWHCADERLRFTLRPADMAAIDTLLAQADAAPPGAREASPLVVVHVGASAPSRRWPPERFGAVAEQLVQARGARVVFTGSAAEAPLIAAAQARMHAPALSLAGRLSLGALGALIARADVVVTNNSGPAHLAAALSTPVVDLYALTNPQHTPWQVPARVLSHDVPCRHCLKSRCPQTHHLCLLGVPVQAAVDAALALLADAATGPAAPTLSDPLLEPHP